MQRIDNKASLRKGRGAPVAHVFAPTGAAAESCHAQRDWRVVSKGFIYIVVPGNVRHGGIKFGMLI